MPDSDPVAVAEAHLRVVTLERKLVEMKAGDDPEKLAECKVLLRAARQEYREMSDAPLDVGDAAAAPEAVTGKVTTRKGR